MMSTLFCNVSTCKRFSLRLALAFCFLSPASSFADWSSSDSAELSRIEDNTYYTSTSANSSALTLQEIQDKLVEELSHWRAGSSGNDNGTGSTLRYILWQTKHASELSYTNDLNVVRSLYTSPSSWSSLPAFYKPDSDSFISAQWNLATNLSTFLFGSLKEPWYTQYPQFRFLTRASSLTTPPGDTMVNQSLVNFLNFTLGQNVDYGSGTPANASWESMFTTNSIYRKTLSASNQVKMGYGLFNLWLAEAQRRLISNTTLTNSDWRALNGVTNPVQAVQASMDKTEQERSISNEVASVESDLNDLFTVDEPDNPSGYNNSDDFSDVVSSLGDDDDSLQWGETIRLASSSQIRSIASEVGLNYAGPSAEISLNSFAGGVLRTDLISPVGSLMVSVWHWVRSLAIFWVVVGWYNRVRALLLMTNPEPSTSGPFRDVGGIW